MTFVDRYFESFHLNRNRSSSRSDDFKIITKVIFGWLNYFVAVLLFQYGFHLIFKLVGILRQSGNHGLEGSII